MSCFNSLVKFTFKKNGDQSINHTKTQKCFRIPFLFLNLKNESLLIDWLLIDWFHFKKEFPKICFLNLIWWIFWVWICSRTKNTRRCINLGSYNYLGFAAQDEYCTPRVIECLEKFGASACASRVECGKLSFLPPSSSSKLHLKFISQI
jgi:hypothetical protein